MNRYLSYIKKEAGLLGSLKTLATKAPSAATSTARTAYTDTAGRVGKASKGKRFFQSQKAKDVALGTSVGAAGGVAGAGASKYVNHIRQNNNEEK